MKKKLLICGATGFIGRNLLEHFLSRDEFEVFGTYNKTRPADYPKVKMIRADLTNKVDVTKAVKGMDLIIQASATTSGAKDIVNSPYLHVTDNAVMNSLIFRAAFEEKVSHLVFFSCTVMYQSSDVQVREEDFDANKQMYPSYFGVGWTKVYLEKMCEFYSRISGTKFTVVRHSNIYGPYDKFDLEKSHVFGATVTKVLTAEEGSSIAVWGKGEEGRDFLYVSDLVSFVEAAIKKQKEKFALFNAGSGISVPVKELVQKIIRHSGKNIRIEFDPSKPSIKTGLCLNTDKAREALGWHPAVTLDEGIKKTILWHKENYDHK